MMFVEKYFFVDKVHFMGVKFCKFLQQKYTQKMY